MDMSVSSAKGRMQLLFLEHRSLLRINQLRWVTENSPKAAIKHVFSAVRPSQLRTRPEQDLEFSHHDLRANFDGFMAHAPDVSAAFEKADSGNPKSHELEKDSLKGKKSGGHVDASSSKAGSKTEGLKKTRKPSPTPCSIPRCQGKNHPHWISECT